jgi:hypothetical protein
MHNPLFPRTFARCVLFAQQTHLAAAQGEADQQQAPVVTAKVGYSIGRGCAKKVLCARRIVFATGDGNSDSDFGAFGSAIGHQQFGET